LSVGAASAGVVAVEARKVAEQRGSGTPVLSAASRDRVISLTARRLASLPGDARPLPSVAAYDQLLGRESL
jgi:hypothetical protein